MTVPADDRLILPKFQEALRRYPEQPSDATSWRWRVGIIPEGHPIRFLVERPDLLEALAADARALANEQLHAA